MIKIYSLSTCGHCRQAKKLLDELGAEYTVVEVDRLGGEEHSCGDEGAGENLWQGSVKGGCGAGHRAQDRSLRRNWEGAPAGGPPRRPLWSSPTSQDVVRSESP